MNRILKNIILFLLTTMVIALGIGTIIEKVNGSEYVSEKIYHSLWFCLLWGFISVLSLVVIFKRKMWRQFSVFCLHLSFLVILAGALTSYMTSKDGTLHLRQGSTADYFFLKKTNESSPLSFSLRLDSFAVECYPGTTAPSDYKSFVTYHISGDSISQSSIISMNNILSIDGYRFYQTSFDSDCRGTILTVNYDLWGTNITYFGYALLALSMIMVLLLSNTFRRLLRHPLLLRNLFLFTLLYFGSFSLSTTAAEAIPSINRDKANELSRQQVIYNNRTAPLNTLACDFLKKIYGKETYRGLSAEQVLFGWGLRPDVWKEQPMILVKHAELRQLLGINGKYAKFTELFNANDYKLKDFAAKEYQGNVSLKKSVQELDEKVGLILMLTQGTLVRPATGKSRVSSARIEAEIIYNALPVTKILFMSCLTLGLFSFFLLLYAMTKGKKNSHIVSVKKAYNILAMFMIVAFLLQLYTYILRWIIIGRIPLSNGYETMLFMALFTLFLGSLLQYRIRYTQPFAFLISGFTLLVSHLGQMSPQITNLMPVLNSPLLSAHVSIIMIAYSLFAFCMLSGIFSLVLMCIKTRDFRLNQSILQLTILSRSMLYPAVFMLAAGIFLGAIWANVSWGNYWSWDPKEVWALITLLVYSLPLHSRSILSMQKPFRYNLFMVLAFFTVLMTFFGVNFLLGGMHSYA